MYVTPPDTDVYSIPKVLAQMPQKVIFLLKLRLTDMLFWLERVWIDLFIYRLT
jgi:hypothetical protein